MMESISFCSKDEVDCGSSNFFAVLLLFLDRSASSPKSSSCLMFSILTLRLLSPLRLSEDFLALEISSEIMSFFIISEDCSSTSSSLASIIRDLSIFFVINTSSVLACPEEAGIDGLETSFSMCSLNLSARFGILPNGPCSYLC
jgi:hypothetical protein